MTYEDFDLSQFFEASEEEPKEQVKLKRNYIFLYRINGLALRPENISVY